MGSRARVVLDPDTEVLDGGRVLLGDLITITAKEDEAQMSAKQLKTTLTTHHLPR